MSAARPLSILIAAVGGQGGGLLADWLSEAAHHAGYPAQATSIPGVAQRTGATTYYFELYPERDPSSEPVFCLFPSAGDVDLVAALEPMEAARSLQNGYVGRATTVITASARLYAIGEKIAAGDGMIPAQVALEALAGAAKRLIVLDAAEQSGAQANALLLGAIAGAGVLPLALENYRHAIEAVDVAVANNLAGFEQGSRLLDLPAPRTERESAALLPCPTAFAATLVAFPAQERPVIGHALARLIDYQDPDYAVEYLQRLCAIAHVDRGRDADAPVLTAIVARRLAAWMMFEDVIRVAQLKTRPGRLARIRAELGALPGEPVSIMDYLKPGWNELRGLLPRGLGRWLRPVRPGRRSGGIALTLATTKPWGYAALRLLAMLRPWRRHSLRFAEEQRAVEAWLEALIATAPRDYALACRLAELAVLARGYGDVRARGLARLHALLADWRHRLAADATALAAEAATVLETARNDPDVGCAPV